MNGTFNFEDGFVTMCKVSDYLVEKGLVREGEEVDYGAEIFFMVVNSLGLEPDKNHLKDMLMALM